MCKIWQWSFCHIKWNENIMPPEPKDGGIKKLILNFDYMEKELEVKWTRAWIRGYLVGGYRLLHSPSHLAVRLSGGTRHGVTTCMIGYPKYVLGCLWLRCILGKQQWSQLIGALSTIYQSSSLHSYKLQVKCLHWGLCKETVKQFREGGGQDGKLAFVPVGKRSSLGFHNMFSSVW